VSEAGSRAQGLFPSL